MTQITSKKLFGISLSVVASAAALAGLSAAASSARETGKINRDTYRMTSSASAPVLVELFTSEGCSSCPPADTLLQDLRKTQSIPGARIIALSEHVDYWNRLGWKDPYSSADYSVRQSDYAKSFKNDQVYTPQIVVDGQVEFVGSDRNAARSAITRAAKRPKAKISLVQNGDSVSVSVAAIPNGAASDVYAAVTESNLTSHVQRGENAGRRLTHAAVTRQLVRLGIMQPGKAFGGTFYPKLTGSPAQESIVAFVQEQGTRKVIGAEEISARG